MHALSNMKKKMKEYSSEKIEEKVLVCDFLIRKFL